MELRVRKTLQQLLETSHPWREIHDRVDSPYHGLLEKVRSTPAPEIRRWMENMEAVLREMGLSLGRIDDSSSPALRWACDLLPQLFEVEEWLRMEEGVQQQLRAWERFLHDIYLGEKEILRQRRIPVPLVLGSPCFQPECTGLKPVGGSYLSFCSMVLTRLPDGRTALKSNHLSRATGIAYLLQNRRAMARVVPSFFHGYPVTPVAELPGELLEHIRPASIEEESFTVMLTAGLSGPSYPGHTLLARRMGIPVVQGNDLIVLDDAVHLKTIGGLKRVGLIFNRLEEPFLDPLAFRSANSLGVPGLIQCLRHEKVGMINAPGSRLADDPALLSYTADIIRFYLGESARTPILPTYWCGDPDQLEWVMDNLDNVILGTRNGNSIPGIGTYPARNETARNRVMKLLRSHPENFVAQPAAEGGESLFLAKGKLQEVRQDHMVYALADAEKVRLLPGALTRIHLPPGKRRGGLSETPRSRDTWILDHRETASPEPHTLRPQTELQTPNRLVTSRVAEAFYWMGRYLERAHTIAYMVQVVETLTTEELNSAERRLYRPVWNAILPPVEGMGRITDRNLTSPAGRYRLLRHADDPGSAIFCLARAMENAVSIQDNLSPEAWSAIQELSEVYQRTPHRPKSDDERLGRGVRRLSDATTRLIPQFFGVAQITILEDDGWKFCEMGRWIERAITSANACLTLHPTLDSEEEPHNPSREIELSAFLRLLATRDAYRRIYQSRAEVSRVLEILWRHPHAPRSVTRCLNLCLRFLEDFDLAHIRELSHAQLRIEQLRQDLLRLDWKKILGHPESGLETFLENLLKECHGIHDVITDTFLTHQQFIRATPQIQLPFHDDS